MEALDILSTMPKTIVYILGVPDFSQFQVHLVMRMACLASLLPNPPSPSSPSLLPPNDEGLCFLMLKYLFNRLLPTISSTYILTRFLTILQI